MILFRFFILWLSSLIGWNRMKQLIKLIGSNKKRISWASENLKILKTLDMLLYQTFLCLSTAKYKIWITKSKTRRILYLYRVSFFTVKIALNEDSCSKKKKKERFITWNTASPNKHDIEIQFGRVILGNVQITIIVFCTNDNLVCQHLWVKWWS